MCQYDNTTNIHPAFPMTKAFFKIRVYFTFFLSPLSYFLIWLSFSPLMQSIPCRQNLQVNHTLHMYPYSCHHEQRPLHVQCNVLISLHIYSIFSDYCYSVIVTSKEEIELLIRYARQAGRHRQRRTEWLEAAATIIISASKD